MIESVVFVINRVVSAKREWIVPWGDMPHNSERFVQDIVERTTRNAQHTTVTFISPTGKILKVADCGVHLIMSMSKWFAILKRQQPRQRVLFGFDFARR